MKRRCRTPPKERAKKGELCELKKKEEYRKKGNTIIDLPKGFGADFAAVSKTSITFVEAKYGSGKLTVNESRLKDMIENANASNIHHDVARCGCGSV